VPLQAIARTLWLWLRLVVGFGLVIVGIIGLFLPVLPGILMILAGLAILSAHYHWARRLMNYLRTRKAMREQL